MDIAFLGQPFRAQFGIILREELTSGRFGRLRIACAWGKRSGLSRVRSALEAFRAAGGQSQIVLGIDEGGATREGLRLAMELFSEPRVYYDPGQRTFHPKVFLLEGDGAFAAVGSWNLTKGGLFTNYEAGITARLAEGEGGDLLAQVHEYLDMLLAQESNCRLLDEALFEELVANPRFGIEPETDQYRRRRQERRAQVGDDVEHAPIFGPAVTGLPGAPAPELPAEVAEEEDDDDSAIAPPPAVPPAGPVAVPMAEPPAGVTGFWKQLSNFDASHSSAPGQIIIPIQFRDFFEDMEIEKDETAVGGVRQSSVHFALRFIDGAFEHVAADARAVLYEPAADHPRPNIELRFTFRDRDVFDRLGAGDVLVFGRHEGVVRVERRPKGAMGAGRFGEL